MTTRYLQFGAVAVVVALTVASLPAGALSTTAPVQFQQDGLPEVTFDDQTSDGTSVTVAAASNDTTPYYTAVWTLDDNGTPETLLGATQVTTNTAENVSVEFDEPIDESQTLIAAVHPDIDGNASTV